MVLSLARIFIVYLPAAWIGVMLFGYVGILVAAVAANLLAVGGAVYLVNRADLLTPPDKMRGALAA